MRYLVQNYLPAACSLLVFGLLNLQPTYAQSALLSKSNVLFILDGSGSMLAKIDNKPKIAIAKEVMTNLVRQLPNGVEAGLEVYGHRSKGDCNDIEIVAPVGQSDKATLIQRIQSIEPKGKTPITESLKVATAHLKSMEEETTVVLISDGKETCEGDPCALIKDLKAQGIKVRVHVVGFDVGQDERGQLMCIAEAGGGKYFTAQNANQLNDALIQVREAVIQKAEVKPEPAQPAKKVIKVAIGTIKIPNLSSNNYANSVDVYEQSSGKKVGTIWNMPAASKQPFLQISPGTYKLKFGEFMLEGIELGAGATQEIQLGTITIPKLEGDTVRVYEQASGKTVGDIMSHPLFPKFLQVPAGTYKLTLHGSEIKDIAVEAGQEVVLE